MSVTVLGVMVPTIIANGVDGEPLPSEGLLVRLTLTEEPRPQGKLPILRSSIKTVIWPDFSLAAQNAFICWSRDRGHVVWKLEACHGRELPPLKGPSLGIAFGVGLTLLHYRGDPGATSGLDAETAASVTYADFSEVAVSAQLLTGAVKLEAMELGAVGGLRWKVRGLEGRLLVVSDQPCEIDTEDEDRIVRVRTVKDAISKVFDLEALTILRTL